MTTILMLCENKGSGVQRLVICSYLIIHLHVIKKRKVDENTDVKKN